MNPDTLRRIHHRLHANNCTDATVHEAVCCIFDAFMHATLDPEASDGYEATQDSATGDTHRDTDPTT